MTSTAWGLLLIAFVITYAWRAVGAAIAGRMDVDMPLFDWFGCVTYALVGGLMVRAIFLAPTALADVPLSDRIFAVVVGIGVFVARGRSVIAGVVAAVCVFAALALWRAGGL